MNNPEDQGFQRSTSYNPTTKTKKLDFDKPTKKDSFGRSNTMT